MQHEGQTAVQETEMNPVTALLMRREGPKLHTVFFPLRTGQDSDTDDSKECKMLRKYNEFRELVSFFRIDDPPESYIKRTHPSTNTTEVRLLHTTWKTTINSLPI